MKSAHVWERVERDKDGQNLISEVIRALSLIYSKTKAKAKLSFVHEYIFVLTGTEM
jgi:hypothetical protein